MAIQTDSGCVNHPGFEAVTRCKQCGKPICAKCIVSAPGGTFCSVLCREKYEEFVKRADLLERSKKGPKVSDGLRKVWRFMFRLVVWIVLLLAIAVGLSLVGVRVPVVADIVNRLINR